MPMTYKNELDAIKGLSDKNLRTMAFGKWCQILLRDNDMEAVPSFHKCGWGGRGFDLIVTRNNQLYATQCLCWNNRPLTADVIDDTKKRARSLGYNRALIIISGSVSQNMMDYGKRADVRVLDGQYLNRLMGDAHHANCLEFCKTNREAFPDALRCIASSLPAYQLFLKKAVLPLQSIGKKSAINTLISWVMGSGKTKCIWILIAVFIIVFGYYLLRSPIAKNPPASTARQLVESDSASQIKQHSLGFNKPIEYIGEKAVVLELMNKERVAHGLRALVADKTLTDIANVRAREIQKEFAHERPDGRDSISIFSDYGVKYEIAGENIASGTDMDGKHAYSVWRYSPGHYANMMTKKYTHVGIGYWQDKHGTGYWVHSFVSPE